MILVLVACKGVVEVEKDPRFPFPSIHHQSDGQVILDGGLFPETPSAFRVDRLGWRTGFSRGQTVVVDPEEGLDATTVNEDTVQLWDLDLGERIESLVELDASPDLDGEHPVLLVRPLEPMAVGHQVAVAVTQFVETEHGQPIGFSWFDALVTGRAPAPLSEWEDDYLEVMNALGGLGVDELAMVTSFTVGDGTTLLRGMTQNIATPTKWRFDKVLDAQGDDLPDRTWVQAEGSFSVPNYLDQDNALVVVEGEAVTQGVTDAVLFVHIPESLGKAKPGSAPVWLFGHGIFGEPATYLADELDPSHVIEVADRAGAIVVATVWRGLGGPDISAAVGTAADIGSIHTMPDMLSQGVVNTMALAQLIREGDLLSDPVFQGLADPGQLMYYGISLGAIEGSILMALDDGFAAGVLHVGGSMWSTMLERSVIWDRFEPLVLEDIESAKERQLVYALSQLFWDPADPINYVDDLVARPLLWQFALGDDQVPNLTSEALMRGVSAPMLQPGEPPVGFGSVSGGPGPVWALFDPEDGIPPEGNRPAPDTESHNLPRTWEGTKRQTLRFLDASDPGVAEHYCGEAPCAASNPG